VGVGSNAGKVMTAETLTASWLQVGANAISLSAATVNFVEGTQSLSEKVSNKIIQGYTVNTTDIIGEPFNFSSAGGNFGDHIYVWLTAYEAWDTLAAGGFRIIIADDLATDSAGVWYVGPQPGYLGGWRAYVMNPSAAFNEVVAGTGNWTTGGNPAQLTGVDGFGGGWSIIQSITGNTDNSFIDCISVGTGYRITLGDSGSTKGVFSDFITFEQTTTTGRYGGLRGISGILFARCKLIIGAASGATNTDFDDSGFTVVWEKSVLSNGTSSSVASDLYELRLKKGSGATNVTLANGLFAAVSPHEVYMNLAGSTSCAMTNITMDRARLIDVDGAVTWTGGSITNSGQFTITGGAPTLNTLKLLNSTDAYAMSISAVSQWANVSNITFDGHGVGGSGSCGLRLNLGAVGGASITLTNVTFQNRVAGSHDILIPADVTGTITINVSGGNTPTVNDLRTPDDYVIVEDTVDTIITVKDIVTGSPIQFARVLLVASDGTGDWPYQEAVVGITSSGTTATVDHTGHGLATDDVILITGANEIEYNGAFVITVTDVDTYTYTMLGDPADTATGTILATGGMFNEETNASGQVTDTRAFTNSQPVTGRVRKGSASNYYQSSPISATINNVSGLALTIQLIPDE